MKKIIICSILYFLIAGFMWAHDIPQPIINQDIIPLTALENLKVSTPKRNNDRPYYHEWEFVQEPTTITGFTNYYDYMPGSYCGHPIMRQPDVFGGVYFTFHGRANTTDNRHVYWAYVHPNGAIEYATITTSDTYEGYPSMTMHPASGDPIVTWHDIMGAGTPEDTNTRATFDDYGLLYIPGFWKTPVTFDQPLPYVDEYLWPYVFIGKAPDYVTTGNYRIYQISEQGPDGEIEHPILRWIDVPQDYYVYGDLDIILDKTNWSGPVNIARDWSDPASGISCRPYPSFAVDPFTPGHVAIFGYACYVNGLTGNEIVPQGFYVWDSYDGGATWSYDNFHSYETDVGMLNEYVLYAVENVPGFTDDEGNPFDSLHVWVGFPGNNCSTNRTAVFDSDGNLHLPELFWISYVDEETGSVTYWPEYAFLFQAEVVYKSDGTWDIRHVANMPGTDAWTGLSVPWEIFPVSGDTLIYPWCDMASNDYSPSGYGNFQHQAVCLENDCIAQIWVSGTEMLCADIPIPGYEDYYHHPIIYLAISPNNGESWSAPIELSDIYSTAFPGFADMITVYPYVDPIIKDLGDGWGRIDMYFFDDNDYGSSINGMGPTTGGKMVYCSIKIDFMPYFLHANFSAEPLSGDAPLTVQFTDESSIYCDDILSWAWDFNYDGTVDSYEENPQWTYTEPGTYTVSLTVNGSKSKYIDTEIKIDYINVYSDDNIIHIPADYATIQEGINAANEGDTILVDLGTYVENINYNGKNITVASLFLTTADTSYISQTVIDGNQNGSVVTFDNGEDSTAVLTGFTITNGLGGGVLPNYSGGGITCNNSDPSFNNLMITDNLTGDFGAGIYCEYSSPNLKHVVISDNFACTAGAGILCNNSSPILENVTITSNSTNFGDGGAICCHQNSSPIIINSILWNNEPQEIYFSEYVDPDTITISYSNIEGGVAGIVTNNNGTVYWLDGNIDVNPLFIDPDNGDYHLSWANFPIQDSTKSPCIDAGDPDSPLDPDGTIADMGAYYFNQNVSIDEPGHSSEYNLACFPNPISSRVNDFTVSFSISKPGKVKIQLFNIKGQLISTLLNEDKNIGDHSIDYSTDGLFSGIYFTKMSFNGVDTEIRKLILLR